MDKSKFSIATIISFLSGIVIGGSGIYYAYKIAYEDYDINMLNDIERMSYEFHTLFEPEASGNAQASYILYSYRAWKAEMISDRDYHLHQAIGYLRFCISLEKRGKEEVAKKSCTLAEEALTLWDKNLDFKKFRKIVDCEDFRIDMLSNRSLKNGTREDSRAP